MDAENILVGGTIGLHEVGGQGNFLLQQEFVKKAEFLRGKNVCAEIQIITGMIDELEGKHGEVRTHSINAFGAAQARARAKANKSDSAG